MINKLYKSAVITGSANGIGYSILKRLVEDGIKVIAIDKDKIGLKKITKEFNVKTINLDLTNTKELYNKLSKIQTDILINNAGIGRGIEGIISAKPKDIAISSKLNVEAHLHVIKAIVPNMIKRRKGHMINV